MLLTLPQVAEAAGIEYRTMHVWLKRGLVRASVLSSGGTGTANLFSREDALEARVLADLRRAGLDMAAIERAARALQARPDRLAGNEVLAVNGTVTVLGERATIDDALAEDRPVMLYRVAWADSNMP